MQEDDDLWDVAYEWALRRAREEGDVDPDYNDDIIYAWTEEYYNYLKG